MNGEAEANGKILSLSGFLTTPQFFDIFGYTLLYGNSSAALNEVNSIVITENTAERFFGKKNPVGEIIKYHGFGDFRITGVIKKPSGKTHLEFDALTSYSSLPTLIRTGSVSVREDDWNDYYMNYTYLKLKDRSQAAILEKELSVHC